MPSLPEQFGIDRLSTEQKLELIDKILDSLPGEESTSVIPSWHLTLLDQRLEQAEQVPEAGLPWREALSKYDDHSGVCRLY
jgi:hypothetical protein